MCIRDRPGTGPWGTGGWGNPNRSTEDLIDGPEEDWYEDAPYRPTNQTEGSDKPTYESTEGPGSENAGPGAGSNRPARQMCIRDRMKRPLVVEEERINF